jgi:hypothetical protein
LGTAGELNDEIANFCAESGLSVPDNFSDDHLARVRERRGELFTEWEALRPGAALELPYDPAKMPVRLPSKVMSA